MGKTTFKGSFKSIVSMKHFLFLFLTLSFLGCNKAIKKMDNEDDLSLKKMMIVTVVDYNNLDGCGWLLMKSDSSLFKPNNLNDSLKINGLRVAISFHQLKDQMSTCMAGTIIMLDEVKMLSK